MSYARVSEVVRRCVDELVACGVSREVAEMQIRTLELAAVQSIIDNQRDQMLLDLGVPTSALAERYGVSERTIREWRKSAANRKSRVFPTSPKAA